jgi:hypothetical protein
MTQVDHLVYAVPDLDEAVERLEQQTGVRAAPGGRHPGRGSRNALASLDGGAYLEIIAPDPLQDVPASARPFGLAELASPRLVTWAVTVVGLDHRVERARRSGYDPGDVVEMSREAPDGTVLTWRLTARGELREGGIVPFLIDWGGSPHPSASAPEGLRLVSLRAEHPRPEKVLGSLGALGVDLDVAPGPAPALEAVLDSPHGPIELR